MEPPLLWGGWSSHQNPLQGTGRSPERPVENAVGAAGRGLGRGSPCLTGDRSLPLPQACVVVPTCETVVTVHSFPEG